MSQNNNIVPLKEDSFEEIYISTKHGISHVLQVGLKNLFTQRHAYDDVSRVIFVVPGNPGSISFYRHFMQLLYQRTGLPVIGASHIGHVRQGVKQTRGSPTVSSQVDHKVDLIETYIPDDVEVVLIGHSIGTYMTTQMMKIAPNRKRLIYSFLLMPVLERMKETSGWRSLRFMLFFRWLLYAIIFLMSLLRDDLLIEFSSLMDSRLQKKSTPECCREALVATAHVSVLRNIFNLAKDEARQVTLRDDTFLRKNIDRLSFIYCHGDKWSPLEYFRDLKRKHPTGDYHILDTVSHDFIMDVAMTEDIVTVVTNALYSPQFQSNSDPLLALTKSEEPSIENSLLQ